MAGDAMTPELQAVATLRRALWANGFRPLSVMTRGKKPLPGKDWTGRARQNPPECIGLDPEPAALSTGILMDQLRGIDLDVDHPELAEELHALALTIFGGDPPVRYRGDSPRRLLLYAATVGAPPTVSIKGSRGGVQILGAGSQALSFGIHPNGSELQWRNAPGTIACTQLTTVTELQVRRFLEQAAFLIGGPSLEELPKPEARASGEPQAELDRIADALRRIPNDGAADWERWNRLGMAVWVASGGSEAGRELWHKWSARNPAYDARTTDARWRNYHRSPPKSLGAGTIFHEADAADQARVGDFIDLGVGAARRAATEAAEEPAAESPQDEAARQQSPQASPQSPQQRRPATARMPPIRGCAPPSLSPPGNHRRPTFQYCDSTAVLHRHARCTCSAIAGARGSGPEQVALAARWIMSRPRCWRSRRC
jgi:hypothetical protein